MSSEPSLETLSAEVHRLRMQVAKSESQRRWTVGLLSVAGLAVMLGRAALANTACNESLPGLLQPLCPDQPALAADVNQNYRELLKLVETKVGAIPTASGVAPGAAGTGTVSTSSVTTGAVSASSVTTTQLSVGGTASVGSLNAASEVGFELSCGEASYYNGTLNGNPFCCRMNVASGETSCAIAAMQGGGSWNAPSVTYFTAAPTNGRYHLSCAAGAPGANYPFCCRINANTGSTVCGIGNTYSLGSAGTTSPF